MLESGEASDFVIEVHQQKDGQQEEEVLLKGGWRTQPTGKSVGGWAKLQVGNGQKEYTFLLSSQICADCQHGRVHNFNVHKVLIANSDVFRAMFSHEDTKEFRESRVRIEDSTYIVVHQMLNYMYTGTFPAENYNVEKDAVPLMSIAHKYQIKPLVEFNEQKLVERFEFEC